MNTLPRAVTAQWFENGEARAALRRQWSNLLHSERRRSLNSAHHLLYLALLGKDWRRSFTPLCNPRKLANGAFVSWAMFGALASIHYGFRAAASLAPFDGLVTPAMLEALRRVMPRASYTDYRPDQFAHGDWPFEAYAASESPGSVPNGENQCD